MSEIKLFRNPFFIYFFLLHKAVRVSEIRCVEVVMIVTGIKSFEKVTGEIKILKVKDQEMISKKPHFVMCISLN